MTQSENGSSRQDNLKRASRTFLGALILLIGLVAIPYPGPGWLIVFAGLAILARDYEWAERLLGYARERYEHWKAWIERQNVLIRGIALLLTAVIVVITIYLLNGYGLLNAWFNLNIEQLNSPLPIFN